jgi:hypothetical protein
MSKQTLAVLPYTMVIHSLDEDASIPGQVCKAPLYFIGKTDGELSIVVPDDVQIDSIESDSDWRVIELLGPLQLSMVGIMAAIGDVLARAKVSIFVVSTFETDFFLVKSSKLQQAVDALRKEGYTVKQ